MDLTVATELGRLAVFGDRRRGYGWLTGFDGYNRVFSWHYCCFHFYCHNRESSWWSEGQSEQFGSVDSCMLVAQSLDPTTFPQLFPRELMAQVEELNREFIRGQKQRQTKIARTNAEFEMVAHDPRIYVAIKEPTDAMFPRTPFVLTNSGGDVAHRVKLEMPWKLKGRNVSFEMVETIPAGENRESLPTIGEEGPTSKHDIFYSLLQDWNGDSRGICEEWPRPLTVRYEDFSGRKRLEISMTLMFYPIKHMLKTKQRFPSWQHYKTWEFRDIPFKRVA